jgi:hypothetical protein
LDFAADYSAITQNTGDTSRIFHTFDKWEAVGAGFFSPGIKGRDREECEQEYGAFLSDSDAFASGIEKVFKEWPNSSEHNLTNSSMNRIAWIGQSAACAARGLPATFRGGFSNLPEEKQTVANELALRYLNSWLSKKGLSTLTMGDALGSRDSDLF